MQTKGQKALHMRPRSYRDSFSLCSSFKAGEMVYCKLNHEYNEVDNLVTEVMGESFKD